MIGESVSRLGMTGGGGGGDELAVRVGLREGGRMCGPTPCTGTPPPAAPLTGGEGDVGATVDDVDKEEEGEGDDGTEGDDAVAWRASLREGPSNSKSA
jgi:hypothetical protein